MNSQLTILAPTADLKTNDQTHRMNNYYRWHAAIYDWTRWTFLFGRQHIIDWLPFERVDRLLIAEIGCGTGQNLERLARRFPKARLLGIDVAEPMLLVAKKRGEMLTNKLTFKQLGYGTEGGILSLTNTKKPDVILFSYCLTMVNPDWKSLVAQAKADLGEGGTIAVVDFDKSRFAWFRRWMRFNHVEMEGQILPYLEQEFMRVKVEKRRAYWGLWTYFVFIGTTAKN